MQSFKQFLSEGMKKAKRRGTREAAQKEANRQSVRMARKQVEREAENEERRANPTGDPQEDAQLGVSDEESLLSSNIFDLIDMAGGKTPTTKYSQLTDKQIETMADVETKAHSAEKQAYAAAWADKIMDRQPIIANKALQDAARRYEIETRTEKKIPLFGGTHKKFIYKHG